MNILAKPRTVKPLEHKRKSSRSLEHDFNASILGLETKFMVDSLGYRMKFGVVAPSTNTSVEPEYALMQPPGITNHFSRIIISDSKVTDDDSFVALVENIRGATMDAIDALKSCDPGYIIMGMSAETFWDGAERADDLHKKVVKRAGRGVAMGSHACDSAFKAYSEEKPIKKIAILTPYMPVGDTNVVKYFTDLGYHVTDIIGLKSDSPMTIAHETPQTLREAIKKLAQSQPDAIVQAGTNLACVSIAAEAERWLEIPVIAINAATYWFALRENGFEDKIYGCGRLLEDW